MKFGSHSCVEEGKTLITWFQNVYIILRKKHKKGYNKPQLSERILKLTKVMLAKSIQDCFHCRSLFHSGTVLAGRFRQVYDNK